MVAGELDAKGRRKRTTPVSTGKRITLQPADLRWLQKLHEHGPLPSSFLIAYTKESRQSDKRSTERLTDLFNEDETKHGGRYLDRPPQQFRTIDSRYNQLVYDLAPAGRRALQEAGQWKDGVVSSSGPWLHRFMVSCTTASVELATLLRDDVSYIPQHRILVRAGTELRYPVAFTDPGTGRAIEKDLIPDAVFGLQYQTPEGRRFRFFAVECDRATEPTTTGDWGRKSWLRSLLQYRTYIAGGRYRDHLRLTAPMLVLNVVTDEKRLSKLITATEKEAGDGGNAYLLFRCCDAFGPVFRPPSPLYDLLDEPWPRAGREPFKIDTA
ncbi:MAG: replication-relaxation family protein [Rhodospirillaceae bacterium]|nr:replication-relaxation family protein [Rhodospirillaceae bacterium]